jgi:hypothetical protein
VGEEERFMRQTTVVRAALAAILGAWAPLARAQEVTVHIDDKVARQAGIDPTQIEQSLGAAVSDNLRLADFQPFMEQMANASVTATKGMGADYATNPQRFVVGFGFGTAINAAGAGFTRGGTIPEGGFALQMSALVGVNLGIGAEDDSPLRRFVVYGNAMKGGAGLDPFHGELFNYGGHLQVKLLKSRDTTAAEWGGLDFTAGYEFASFSMNLQHELPIPTGQVTWKATGDFDISSTAASVPLELSTNVRVLVFSAYGGAALDINEGSEATSSLSLSGPITADVAGQTYTVGDATVSKVDTGIGNFLQPRFFGGLQLDIAPFKLYGHLNLGMDQDFQHVSFGGHVGARFSM